MSIDWPAIAREVKKRRELVKVTQDWVASKIGVRLATIARIEIGDRRPSLPMLEKLSKVLECQITDLIMEKADEVMGQPVEIREPSMKGAPSYFRYCVRDAASQKLLGITDDGETIRADYAHPGWHLAIHVEEYLTDEASEELEHIVEETSDSEFQKKLLEFFDQEFPYCMTLIPVKRREKFLEGVLSAWEEGRFP